jgi:uncharacterized Zn-binding protein involved in type VI secretion
MAKAVMREALDFSSLHKDPSYECGAGATWQGSSAKSGAKSVFVNGRPIMRKGDPYHTHYGFKHELQGDPVECVEVNDQHSQVLAAEGSFTVFAEGRAVHLTGQSVECDVGGGSKAVGGSPNVFAA